MAYTNISGLFTGICDAIRTKGGAVGTITHQNIPNAILNISGGGGLGCDIGFIYLDPDPFKPSGGGNNSSNGGGNNSYYSDNGGGNNSYSSGNSGGGNNGGSNYSYGNGGNGGNNGGGVNYSPLAQMVCSENIYSLDNFYAFHPINMNYYPACGPNVMYMNDAFRMDNHITNVVGSPVFGPNVLNMCNAYRNCAYLAGSLNAPLEYDLYVYADDAFHDCGNLSGSMFPGGLSGTNMFRNCYNLQSIEVSGATSYTINSYYGCSNLSDVIYKKRQYAYYNIYENTKNYDDPDAHNCFPMESYDIQYANYWNCFQEASTYNNELNLYCYNEYDYNFLKERFFNNFFNGGSNVRARTFGNETSPTGETVGCWWNVYDGNGTWNNYNREMNVIKRCNSSTSQHGAGPAYVTLYYVS